VDFNFKGLTARRLYKSLGVKGLSKPPNNLHVYLERTSTYDLKSNEHIILTSNHVFKQNKKQKRKGKKQRRNLKISRQPTLRIEPRLHN
jgi:hypothetical protein